MIQKILVLDDEENYAVMLQELLEQHNFIVDSVTKPQAALDALQEVGYELVISDFKMPVMDGSDFLKKARSINPDLPFILVSGLMNTPELVKVANMGVTLVLEKPIDVDTFMTAVKRFVTPLSDEELAEFKKRQGKGDGESDEFALDENFEPTYPQTLKYTSALALPFQTFLQKVWDEMAEEGDICVSVPEGAEIDLLLRDLSLWRKQPADLVHIIPGDRIGKEGFSSRISSIAGDAASSNFIGVTGLEGLEVGQQARLLKFVEDPTEFAPDAVDITFVYFVPDSLFETGGLGYNPELYSIFQDNACRMPAFKERLADVATYVVRYLKAFSVCESRPEKADLADDALGVFLQYEWPGNFCEMLSVIRRAVMLSPGSPVKASELTEILKRRKADVKEGYHVESLESGLLAKQQALLGAALSAMNNDMDRMLDVLELDFEKKPQSANEFPLICPDLVADPDAL